MDERSEIVQARGKSMQGRQQLLPWLHAPMPHPKRQTSMQGGHPVAQQGHLEDEAPQQLVLQAGLRDGEVDERDLGAQLGAVVRPRQARGAVQPEALVKVHLHTLQPQSLPLIACLELACELQGPRWEWLLYWSSMIYRACLASLRLAR